MAFICQAYLNKFPREALLSFTSVEFGVLDICISTVADFGNHVPISQYKMASLLGCSRKSVVRAMKKLRDLGLIQTIRRFNQSCFVSVTNFFSFRRVRASISHFFTKYPLFDISLDMLLTAIVPINTKIKINEENNPDPDPDLDMYISLNPSVLESYKHARETLSPEKGEEMAKIDNLLQKALKIEAGLFARGDKEPDVDTAKLCAFSEACLDFVSERMKYSTPAHPFRFFMACAFEYSRDNDEKPDFAIADFVRTHGLLDALRPDGRTAKAIQQQVEMKKKEIVRSEKSSVYTQELKDNAARDKRLEDINKANFEEYKKRNPVKMLTQEEKNKVDPSNPYLQIMIQAGRRRLATLDPESGDAAIIRTELATWGVYS